MSKDGPSRIEGVVTSILRRASYDQAFRSLALTDIDAMFQNYGVKLPEGSKIRFVECGESSDECSIELPPLTKIVLEEDDLKVIVGEQELRLARYENWRSGHIEKLFQGVTYENWGSEK